LQAGHFIFFPHINFRWNEKFSLEGIAVTLGKEAIHLPSTYFRKLTLPPKTHQEICLRSRQWEAHAFISIVKMMELLGLKCSFSGTAQ
jgi:hypothetical protein